MKSLSIRLKITLWFSAALIIVVSVAYAAVFYVSEQVLQKTICDSLVETVENNVDEVEYYSDMDDVDDSNDVDQFLIYESGYLEIDDDFLNEVNEVYTALYKSDGVMLYGENPIAQITSELAFADSEIQRVKLGNLTYYVFDRRLDGDGLDGLWLRGVVSELQGSQQMSDISSASLLILPGLLLLAVVGGYLIARRMLRPIQEISRAASQIGRGGDLKKRIEIGKGKDELHSLADSFNEMFERLDDAFEKERQFTSDASHELRTPVTVILAQCELSLEKDRSVEEYKKALAVIERQGNKMSRLVNDMLEFTRLETRTDSYLREELDLSELSAAVCHDLSLIKERGITLSFSAEDGIMFCGNRELLTRLLTNLISNAYKYGKENGHIFVNLIQTQEEIKLSVADDGIGIKKEEQQKIFQRFYRSDSSRSGSGAGLGLSIVSEIAQLHNGRISVDSEEGKGSIFTLILKK